MPKPGITVETCILTKLLKNKGDAVKAGEVIFSYETDKAAFDEEAPVDGVMLDVFFDVNDEVPCLQNVCVIGSALEDVSSFKPVGASSAPVVEAAAPVAAAVAAPVAQAVEVAEVKIDGDLKISNRAKNLAAKSGADLRYVAPTGPNGRAIERDIRTLIDKGLVATGAALAAGMNNAGEGTGIGGRVTTADLATGGVAAVAASVPVVEFEDVKMSNIRKMIAKSMVSSLSNMAQLTHTSSFDATNILAFRSNLKKNGEKLGIGNITINDIIIYTVSRVLKNHKDLNAHLIENDTMRYFSSVNMGMAVDTPRGLLVPTLNGADKMSLTQISAAAKTLAKDAQAGTISPELLKGGTFTISNLGTYGIESFTPVINPPQTGILGVNTITTRVREVNGEIKPYQAMTLSLTYDHRAIDGAPASRFLKELCDALENFSLFLAI